MGMMSKMALFMKFAWVLVFVVFVQLAVTPTLAQETDENFQTTLTTRYEIDHQAKTRVIHEFQIVNKTPTMYLSQYALDLGSSKLKDFQATVNDQSVTPHVVQTDEKSSIAISFSEPIVGEGQTQNFSLSYHDPAISDRVGQVVEINIPHTLGSQTFADQKVMITVPIAFGQPSRVEPKPDSQSTLGDQLQFQYQKRPNRAIALTFGNYQIFDVKIKYLLRNPNSRNMTIPIALPPDTPYQRVLYTNLYPQPNRLYQDNDHNWIAEYDLSRYENLTVKAELNIKTLLESDPAVPTPPILPAHTQAQEYWESDTAILQSASSKIGTIPALSQSVIEKLSYAEEANLDSRQRLGAVAALNNPANAVCQEYTDLFIGLARAQKIPAVAILGYAFTTDESIKPIGIAGDVLHTWPEAFDQNQQTWWRLDPTWEDTSDGIDFTYNFDLNHLVFARNGVSSTQPSPAGSYDPELPREQLVEVKVGNSLVLPASTVELSIEQGAHLDHLFSNWSVPRKWRKIRLNWPFLSTISLVNQAGAAIYPNQAQYQLTTDSENLDQSVVDQLPTTILPFQTHITNLILKTPQSQPYTSPVTVTIQLNDQTFIATSAGKLLFLPEAWFKQDALVDSVVVVGGLALGALIAGSLLVYWRKRHRAVRGQSQVASETSSELH